MKNTILWKLHNFATWIHPSQPKVGLCWLALLGQVYLNWYYHRPWTLWTWLKMTRHEFAYRHPFCFQTTWFIQRQIKRITQWTT